jgi:hypothetical protein
LFKKDASKFTHVPVIWMHMDKKIKVDFKSILCIPNAVQKMQYAVCGTHGFVYKVCGDVRGVLELPPIILELREWGCGE